MSRLGLLLSVLSLLFVSSLASSDVLSYNFSLTPSALGAGVKSAGWTQVTRAAQWSGRSGGVVEWYSGNVWLNGKSQRGNWLLLYGAGVWDCLNGCSGREEVWASANKGSSWYQVDMQAPYNALLSAQTVQDHRGYQWRIQGTDERLGCDGALFSDVYMSTDGGYRWTPVGDGLPSDTSRFLGTAVVDSANNIYVIHGQTCQNNQQVPLNDVWTSSNAGKTWRLVGSRTNTRLPAARSVHGSVVGKYYDPTTKAAVDAIYIMFGWRGALDGLGNLYRNDVWVSTTGATTWTQITDKASWTARGDSQLEVTSKGVLVIAGGVSNIEGTERRVLNDVWASLDGGYTWGICSDNARWDDRQFQYTAIDDAGYLYVMGGRAFDASGNPRQANDVWVSAQSYDDIDAVANMCGLVVPPCGVGLRCMPNEETFYQGVWGVACDACPWNPNVSGSTTPAASMTMTYLFVAFLLISIVLAGALGFLIYRMRQSGVSSPIPLPASAQRWWSDKQAADGLSEGLNKGSTSSEADSMYNPLTIRDQM